MLGDRRVVVLIGGWAVLATAVAAAAVLVPLRVGAIGPTPGDVIVGASFLAASVVTARRVPLGALLLGLAGVLWVAVGLAPLVSSPLDGWLPRLALLPSALLVVVAAMLPEDRVSRSPAWTATALAVGAGVVGGAGYPRFALLVIGIACGVVPLLSFVSRRRDAFVTSVQAALAVGLVAVGLLAAGFGDVSPAALANLHAVVMVLGTSAVAWIGVFSPARAVTDSIELEAPLGLGKRLGVLLGAQALDVCLAGPDGTWLDAAGKTAKPQPDATLVSGRNGLPLAMVAPASLRTRLATSSVRRLLESAAEGARLRAALRDRAREIAASRERLQTASDDERQRLVALLEAGPLRRLDELSARIECVAVNGELAARVVSARQALTNLVVGIDPVTAAGSVSLALERLTADAGADYTADCTVDAAFAASDSGEQDIADSHLNILETIPAGAARAIWFTCAEGLANAAKYAPGGRVRVTLSQSNQEWTVKVCDQGPGGADPGGSGLVGLAERAAAVGGRFSVQSDVDGTVLELQVPRQPSRVSLGELQDPGFPSSDALFSPIPEPASLARAEL